MEKAGFVVAIEKNDPELAQHLATLRDFTGQDGALPARIKLLMAMLADALLAHADGVKALAELARAAGASEAEIAETVRMALQTGGLPALVTATHAYKQ